jgi:hypothetical protein
MMPFLISSLLPGDVFRIAFNGDTNEYKLLIKYSYNNILVKNLTNGEKIKMLGGVYVSLIRRTWK